MKAIIQTDYGSVDVLQLVDLDKPACGENKLLIKNHAASIHAGDYFVLKGEPYLARMSAGLPKPKNYIPGYDFAGVVEEIGAKVTSFKIGDAVFGSTKGTCCEYICVTEKEIAAKPENLDFDQAAAIPTSGLAALNGIRDAGKVKEGQKVLINGASGGVGTYAVQIAKAVGAEVTAVCSTANVELVKSLGADYVIDYKKEDFTKSEQRFDLILDQVANHSLSDCRKVLNEGGKHIPNSGNGGLGYVLAAFVQSIFISKQGAPFISVPNQADLITLKEMIESNKLNPVIGKVYTLKETAQAFEHIVTGHARGKVVIKI